jgi:hypothetical protein
MDFQRNINIKKAMNIGLGCKRAFDTKDEAMAWLYSYKEEIEEFPFESWEKAIEENGSMKIYMNWGKLSFVKWLKNNIKVKELMYETQFLNSEERMGLKECKLLADEFQEFIHFKKGDKLKKYKNILNLIEGMK